ncbi:vitamin K epoxide reductase family protein [Kineococcus xinjiangensis]|uniref:Vitamin K epoxide reductase family protein n=1 Tax=Kineococcus xinjiangensis TaxID=512762 RepID=A0A2S6IVC5_9ACTN|nr:vitamin K epoxide reductase family protein [Kineococcus xinjiangensis]PPK98158.1 vitamin K epoxide reductase family protein [Kineococcus xinjiangensis]
MTRLPVRERPAGPPAASVRPSSSGIGRSSSEAAEAVSDALRRGAGPYLDRRRRTAALALAAISAFVPVAAYQSGVLRHLPDPPLPGLDSDAVDASGEAYNGWKTPDAALGIASYAVTLALAGMGSADRATSRPWIPLALAAKVGVDVASALYLSAEQVTKHKKLCTYCTVASAFTVAMLPQVLPEARAAWRSWRR